MNEVTLMHYTPGLTDLVMVKATSVEDALAKSRMIPEDRSVYLSVEDADAPNGIRLTKVERASSLRLAIYTDPTGPQVTELHNTVADKEVKRFATRTAAIDKTTKVLSGIIKQRKESEKVEAQVIQSEAAAAKIRTGSGRPKVHADDMVVILKVVENPKKAGKENHKRFQAMMDAMTNGRCTVAQAVASGASRPDLVYDEAHGYIEVAKA